ncbi:MAG: hypothetical protein ACYDBP_06655 [Leptospirales bacterium]
MATQNPDPDWWKWVQIFGGGSIGGFVSSLLLDPMKKWLYRPRIQFDFPINAGTDLQNSSTTPYISLIIPLKDPSRPLESLEEKISIRLIIENKSRFFTAESCRVFLTSIETRDNPQQEWKTTEYKENNQVAWTEKQFEFDQVDIFPQTARAIEPLILLRNSTEISVRIPEIHFSFGYLFHAKTQKGKGWKFSFLAVGKNLFPTPFEFVLESHLKESLGIGIGKPLLQINDCPLDFSKLYLRNILDPTAQENLRKQDFSLEGNIL